MGTDQASLPVIIGVGQARMTWDGQDASTAPSPKALAAKALENALSDLGGSGLVKDHISSAVFVRLFEDSLPHMRPKFGQQDNIAEAVLSQSDLTAQKYIYSALGGDQPQALVNQFATRLSQGLEDVVVLCGSEALATQKLASKNNITLDWSGESDEPIEDWGNRKRLLTKYEIENGLGNATQTYAAIDHALRGRLGMDRQAYSGYISRVFARFSEVAAAHPIAQFPTARTAEDIAAPARDNRPVSDPYMRWHVAQDAVNQGAAVILTTDGRARDMGIDPGKFVYLHGHTGLREKPVSERADLSRSMALETALDTALARSNVAPAQVAHFDIYSCFPCVVLLAAEALGLDPLTADLTVTGGLPFFGGPGNNYSMHAIATMAQKLRDDAGSYGLVLANGGFLSKQAAGVYSTTAPDRFEPADDAAAQAAIDAQEAPELVAEDCDGVIEAYSIVHGRHAPQHGFALAKTADGRRVVAKFPQGHRSLLANWLTAEEPLGQSITVRRIRGRNLIMPADRIEARTPDVWLGRRFDHIRVSVDGPCLEVTINRPDARNALHSAAHYELAEIWDEFERRDDLWLAILTGAGDKAFCSGNDLKATQKGGDQSWPPSGFAGLTHRFNREKPIICAVNGVAMGGGMEIVLSCDLAVAAQQAKFALPEVKVGLFAAAGGVQRLTRQIGRKAAMDMILTGRAVGADEALGLGIVNRVTDEDALTAARSYAREVAMSSPVSTRASKRALNAMDEAEDLQTMLKGNRPILDWLLKTKDFREGVNAFVEKRAPDWKNE